MPRIKNLCLRFGESREGKGLHIGREEGKNCLVAGRIMPGSGSGSGSRFFNPV
jgi:hypothetical protein